MLSGGYYFLKKEKLWAKMDDNSSSRENLIVFNKKPKQKGLFGWTLDRYDEKVTFLKKKKKKKT